MLEESYVYAVRHRLYFSAREGVKYGHNHNNSQCRNLNSSGCESFRMFLFESKMGNARDATGRLTPYDKKQSRNEPKDREEERLRKFRVRQGQVKEKNDEDTSSQRKAHGDFSGSCPYVVIMPKKAVLDNSFKKPDKSIIFLPNYQRGNADSIGEDLACRAAHLELMGEDDSLEKLNKTKGMG
ncbi:hypothetical protein L218DRAFT_950300 [Marasmius fiardii PR-910]|nr:hypothetical protein L218DRAFT_950300 [Marasmius fiardii PR-910]